MSLRWIYSIVFHARVSRVHVLAIPGKHALGRFSRLSRIGRVTIIVVPTLLSSLSARFYLRNYLFLHSLVFFTLPSRDMKETLDVRTKREMKGKRLRRKNKGRETVKRREERENRKEKKVRGKGTQNSRLH